MKKKGIVIIHDCKAVEHTFICRFRERFPRSPVGPDLPPSQPLSAHLLDGILCILVARGKCVCVTNQVLTT